MLQAHNSLVRWEAVGGYEWPAAQWAMDGSAINGWDVSGVYVRPVTVSAADCDRFGHTNNVVYLTWLERVAWAHTESLGLGFDSYERLGVGCVARRHELDYLAPTFAGERLWLGTWISENDGRLTMWRNYQIIREQDQRTVLRARTYWVCIDMASGRPRRQPAEFVASYRPLPKAGQIFPSI